MSHYSFPFERLETWQKAREYSLLVYQLTARFPDTEKFGLVSQMRRAAVSVSSNIAEGSTRSTGKEQARFTEIAYGSLLETLSQAYLAMDLLYITGEQLENIRISVQTLAKMLSGLKRSQLNH